ncbi:MAG: ACP S-malonyltransferase [Spirochaetaceae bacterium]|jgi:[acyl-carrier-protein] S-malonyltransferase|nr:ACP S-malonyltransferase [Spirochaetaceae bacterium]
MTHIQAVFLFPGQGAQYKGMGADFEEAGGAGKALFGTASAVMGRDMGELLRNADAETLKRTDLSQPAITLVNLAAFAYLGERGVMPAGCAGFSLGEYAALAAAGVVSFEDCFKLVKARGEAMQEAVDRIGTGADAPGMAAVLGLPPEQAALLVSRWRDEEGLADLYAANLNSPRQVVVAGTAKALKAAAGRFKEAGARRVVPLAVAGPFHSPLMEEARERFAPALAEVPFHDPRIPLYSNVTGAEVRTGSEAKALSLRHIVEPVRWVDEEAAVAGQSGLTVALETGPGTALQGLWKEINAPFPCVAAGKTADIDGITGVRG